MAQQIFNQWAPVAKAQNEQGQEVYIPFGGIHAQTRDGKDEVIVGAANMQKDDVTGLYLPTDKDFPLEARVRHLEALIGKLDALKETNPDAASATLLALLRGLLAALGKETTLASILAKLSSDPATESTLDDVKGLLAALGATSDAAETDPSETASQIALLKGLLTLLGKLSDTVADGAQKVTLTGQLPPSAMEIYGPTAAQRPAANSVPVGAVYMAVNTGEIWQSNGTDWVVLA